MKAKTTMRRVVLAAVLALGACDDGSNAAGSRTEDGGADAQPTSGAGGAGGSTGAGGSGGRWGLSGGGGSGEGGRIGILGSGGNSGMGSGGTATGAAGSGGASGTGGANGGAGGTGAAPPLGQGPYGPAGATQGKPTGSPCTSQTANECASRFCVNLACEPRPTCADMGYVNSRTPCERLVPGDETYGCRYDSHHQSPAGSENCVGACPACDARSGGKYAACVPIPDWPIVANGLCRNANGTFPKKDGNYCYDKCYPMNPGAGSPAGFQLGNPICRPPGLIGAVCVTNCSACL
jgi:hypothetical protein